MPLQRLTYQQARANAQRDAASWPRKPEQQRDRLSPFARPEFCPSFTIQRDDPVFTIGSCFARNIESQMLAEGFNVAIARFNEICEAEGVAIPPATLNKFVVHSIANELSWALDPNDAYPEGLAMMVGRDRYLDFQLAPGLRPNTQSHVMAMRRAVTRYMALAGQASVIVITLGLVEAWYDNVTGLYLDYGPLKAMVEREPDRFELHVLDYNEIITSFERIIRILTRFGRPDVRILMTVSPVALGMTFTDSDALVANCYSKSVQRAAAEYLYRKHDIVDYFPSYESVTLSERHVAWDEDQAHVSDEVVRLNVMRMMRAYTTSTASDAPPAATADEDASAAALVRSLDAERAAAAGDTTAADRLFAEAVALAPGEALIHLRRGQFLFDHRRLSEARIAAEQALRLGAGRHGAHFLLGRICFRQRDYAAGEPYLREAMALEPDRFGVLHMLARLLMRLGRPAEAYAYFERAICITPSRESVLQEFMEAARQTGRQVETAELFAKLLNHPEAPSGFATLRQNLLAEIPARQAEEGESSSGP